MSNPLVAAPESTTKAYSGIPIAEDAAAAYEGLSSGSWVEGGLGAVALATDIADTVANPFGALFAAGAGWLMEHFEPLRQALDWLAGKPEVIASYGQTWSNVSQELAAIQRDHADLLSRDLPGWQGAAAEGYRASASGISDALASASSIAGGLSTATTIMGALVDAVRSTVRDLIARLVGNCVQWLLEEAFTLGLATPVVVGQVTVAVSNAMAKVSKLVAKVTGTIRKVNPLLEKLKGLFAKVADKLKGLRRTSANHTPTAHGTPKAHTGAPEVRGGGIEAKAGDPRSASSSAERPFCKDDPVDVTTGEVVLSQTDLELPGILPLVIARHHQSGYRAGGLFGSSWSSTLDQRVELTGTAVWLATADGRLLRFPVPADGESVAPDHGPRFQLSRTASGYQVTDPEGGRTLRFAPLGPEWTAGSTQPLAAITHRGGSEVTITYSDDGAPVELHHSGGYRVRVDTADGLVTRLSTVTPAGSVPVMRYSYDGGHLAEAVNSSGQALRFTHSDDGKLTSWTDRNSQWYRYVYDSDGRVTTTIGSGGALNGSFHYGDRVTTHTDTLGGSTRYEMNELGQVVREVNPLGAVTLREWDAHDRLLAVTDPLGHTTRYTYDEAGNTTSVTRPDGSATSAVYNSHGLPVLVTDRDGSRWVREYDESGGLVAETDPAGATTRFERGPRGAIRAITDPVGAVTRFETDAAGLVVASANPLGATTRHSRDAFGRVVETVTPLGATTRWGWTVEGKPLFRTDPNGATVRWRYDAEGNQVSHLDALGQLTTTEVGHFDTPVAKTTADGARTTYAYDTELRLVGVTNPQGLTWRYEYDGAGNVVRETDFNHRTLTYTYDSANRLTSRTNGVGQTVRFEYDATGEVIAKHTPDGTTTFQRDAKGRIIRADAPDVVLTLTRDAAGRVVTEAVEGRVVESAFDAAGRRFARRTPSGVESTWEFDAVGNPVALHGGGNTMSFQHDAAGQEVRREVGAVVVARTWDATSRLVGQRVTTPAGLVHRGMRYRPDGILVSLVDGDRTSRFELDPLGRVTGVHGAEVQRYSYDSAGNITNSSSGGVHQYAGTLLRATARTHYTHDAQGRVIARDHRTLSGQRRSWRYTWDAEDRLTSVTTPDGSTWRYRYDPLGRRVSKEHVVGGAVTARVTFAWDGARLVEQTDAAVTTTWEYAPNTFTPVSQLTREQVDARFHAIVTDQVGTPTELVTPEGGVAWRARATLWGRTTTTADDECPLRFPGQYHDAETGWHYNLHRYYDPDTGRYASPDPLGLAAAPNPSTYVPNPTRQIDPLGLICGEQAKQQALRDAGVPEGAEPLDAYLTPSTTPNGRQVMDANHQPVMFPEEVYEDVNGNLVVFQDHYTGHDFGDPTGLGNQPPHVHVRPYEDPRHGQVPGAQEHYYYDPNLGRPGYSGPQW
ncbi:DUF6531 domain-containing protein [Actinokineospora sp. NBRC 105648]|uniref:DUF6531 domain-containing protein n=1 Tax=Actinokineospora sp. NBRC 105648 TaxID=3032206 RepID=UPI0024A4B412|nr:DUF6531 domain-containing protein [Actinokineospora sp. NBRC 105648]GLZ37633.1 type IV secretion protein Rhs [Actinokineospora sp. NBRC 105648]